MADQIRASHILISHAEAEGAGTELSREAALVQIGELRTQIAGGADFADTAREWSDCPSSRSGGDLGYFAKGAMVPEFEDAAFGLAVGDTSAVVETVFGFHLIHRTA
jgi:parvulin-like peptidyl-prolyl isomerase